MLLTWLTVFLSHMKWQRCHSAVTSVIISSNLKPTLTDDRGWLHCYPSCQPNRQSCRLLKLSVNTRQCNLLLLQIYNLLQTLPSELFLRSFKMGGGGGNFSTYKSGENFASGNKNSVNWKNSRKLLFSKRITNWAFSLNSEIPSLAQTFLSQCLWP